MNMISFANFESFDLSGAAPVNGELPEGVEEFSALFTSFTVPQPQTPVPEELPPTDITYDFAVVQSDGANDFSAVDTTLQSSAPISENDTTPVEPLWSNMIIDRSPTKPWQAKFGIDRIASQVVEGAIDADVVTAIPIKTDVVTAISTKTDVVVKTPLAETDSTPPNESPDPTLWAGNTRPETPDYKKHLQNNGPVKPDIIVPGDTPPIIVLPTGPVKDPARPSILNYQNTGESKKVRNIPVVIPIIVPPVRTSFDGPPREALDQVEFPDGPTGVNESGGVLTEFPIETGGIKPPRQPFFPFDGPPREINDVPDVYIEPTGVQPVEDVAFIPKHILSGIKMTPFDLAEPPTPKSLLTARLDGSRIRGFELTPSDVQSIAVTFENLLRPDNIKHQEISTTVKPATEPLSATTFQEIAESIRASVQAATENGKVLRSTGIVRAAEVIAEIRPAMSAFSDRGRVTNQSSVNTNFEPVPEPAGKFTFDSETANVSPFSAALDTKAVEAKPALVFDPSDLSRRDLNEVTFDTAPMENDTAAIVDKKPIGQPLDLARADELWQQQQVTPKQIEEQVSPHLLELAALAARKNEKQSLKMRLNPAELGSVEIRLERNDNGQLSAHFRTETDMAQTALSQNMESLRETLQNAGWQVGQFEVSTGGGSTTAQQNHTQQDRNAETYANFDYERGAEQSETTPSDDSDRLLSLLA